MPSESTIHLEDKPQIVLPTTTELSNNEDVRLERRRRVKHRLHFFLGILLSTALWVLFRKHHTSWTELPVVKVPQSKLFEEFQTLIPVPEAMQSNLVTTRCTSGSLDAARGSSDGVFMKKHEVMFPRESSSHLFELVGGGRARGSVTVYSQSCEDAYPVIPVVTVTLKHPSLEVLKHVSICEVSLFEEDVHGLLIKLPESAFETSDEAVQLDIRIPTSLCVPAYLPKMRINLPGLVHTLESSPSVMNSVEILSDDATIINEGLPAQDFIVSAKNSPIKGYYNVTNSIYLATSNAPIDVKVDAYHTKHHFPTDVRLKTSNAHLSAVVSLFNTTEHSFFRAFTSTSNAPSDVNFTSTPVNGFLRINTKTSNAEARLALDAAYEGVYVLQTSNAKPVVERVEGVEDPTGAKRERTFETNYEQPNGIGGRVYWGQPQHLQSRHHESFAIATTSNKAVTLFV